MPAITSTGLGSGLEINKIVEAIVDAEKVPVQSKIDREAKKATEQISALGSLSSTLSSFKDSYSKLSKPSSFAAVKITSSDTGVLNATSSLGAKAGSYDIKVEKIAQPHTLVSSAANKYSSINSEVGEGKLTFRFGTYDENDGSFAINANAQVQSIDVASGTSLAALRDQINDSKDGIAGVTASTIDDGSGFRLVLTRDDTGEAQAIEIAVDNPTSSGLSNLAYNGTTKKLTETVVAQDAKIVMNGITITRETNKIENVIEGVTLDLTEANKTGESVKLTIKKDTSEVESQLRAFVENYNKAINNMNELTRFDSANGEKGVLIGDASVRNIQSILRSTINSQVEHIEGSIHSFADMGFVTKRDGTLEIIEDDPYRLDFKEALNDIQGLADFFTAKGTASDSQVDFVAKNSLTKPGEYKVEVTSLAEQANVASTTAVTNLTVDATNNTFNIRVDGVLSNDVKLEEKTYASVDEMAAEIQSKINSDATLLDKGKSVTVTVDSGKLVITSNEWGNASKLGFPSLDPNVASLLNIVDGTSDEGVDISGKIDGLEAFGDGRFLLSENGNSLGMKVEVTGGPLGSRGTVTYTEGLATVLDKTIEAIVDKSVSSTKDDIETSDTILDGKIDSLYKRLASLDEQEEKLKFRMDKMEARLFKQFNAMDTLVASLNNTMGWLQSSLDALPGYTHKK